MAYNDELIKLRSRLIDAVQLGLVEKGSADAFEAVLSQIMTDAEKNKQNRKNYSKPNRLSLSF